MIDDKQIATAVSAPAAVLLSLRGITKSFGAVRALDGVDLDIGPAEVLGLMGDNGAGKSTLTKIIAGNFPPTQGQIILDGDAVAFDRPAAARDAGIEVMYQDLAISENLTAAANIFLGREMTRRIGPLRFLDHRAMNRRAAELFRELKSETRSDGMVKQMSGGQRQAVAIARTRLAKAKLVLMDEPTAAISVRQVAEVLDLIRRLRDWRVGGDPDQPSHAGCVHRMRSYRGAATRTQGRRQASRRHQPRRSHRPDHRRDRGGLIMASAASEFTNVNRLAWHRRGFFGGQTAYMTLAFIIICGLAAVFSGNFTTTGNLLNISRNFSYIALMSLGMTVVIITGGIDLSVGSVCALVAVCSMIVMRSVANSPLAAVPYATVDRPGRRRIDRRGDDWAGQRAVDRARGRVPVRDDTRHAVDLPWPDIRDYAGAWASPSGADVADLLRRHERQFRWRAGAGRLRPGGGGGAWTGAASQRMGPPSVRRRRQ